MCDPRVGKVETNRAQGFAELDVSRTVRDPALPQKCELHPRNDMQNCLSSDLQMHAPVHMNMHTERERLGGGAERDPRCIHPSASVPHSYQMATSHSPTIS